jgi:hypothetical protein
MQYQFIERYAPSTDSGGPEAVVQTRVGIIETIKSEIENPRGAPDRREMKVQTIYTERPAELGTDGAVIAAVRRYDTFRLPPDRTAKPSDPRPLEGLSIWYQRKGAGNPLVLSLTEGRPLREREFGIISQQMFLPALAGLLPQFRSRIGDRWRVPPSAARVLLGPQAAADQVMVASFKDLRTAANGTHLVATFSLTAQPTPYQAEILFTFAPPGPPTDDSRGSTVVARGFISEIRSAQSMTTPLPQSNGRLRQIQTRELVVARVRDEKAPLTVPDPKPTPTDANSWLTYVDPQRRFHLRHPQSFVDESPPGDVQTILVQQRPGGPDVVTLRLQIPTGDPAADQRNRDPELHRKELAEQWRLEHQDVVAGSHGWLPEADWKPAEMRAYRIEAISQGLTGGRPVRLHLDYYLVLTTRAQSLVVTAQTLEDSPLDFRKQVEAMIRTFGFETPEK